MEFELQKLECRECGHKWIPRISKPLRCPRCFTLKWNLPEKAEVAID